MRRVLFAALLISAFSILCSAQQTTYYFPQIASGTFSGGSWTTTIFITNGDVNAGSGTITFNAADGSNWNLQWVDSNGSSVGAGNTISFTLNPGEVRKYISVSNAPLNTGMATVATSVSILGTALFSEFNSGGGLIGEAGVPISI